MDLRMMLVISLLLMVIVMRPSTCLERFGWKDGDPCEFIPFPFGANGTALPGFELNCSSGEAYLLPSENQSYLITDISINTVTINARNIYNKCQSDNGSEIIEDNSDLLSIEGTPYTVSGVANELLLFGCNYLLVLFYTNGTVHIRDQFKTSPYQSETGCAALCLSALEQSECLGYRCCKAALPNYGLKTFSLSLMQITNYTTDLYNIYPGCSVAFIAKEGSGESIINISSVGNEYYPFFQPLTLEWAIGNTTCQEAKKRPENYLCKENSECRDSDTNFGGYYCNCSQGFQGNPYVLGGCTGMYLILNP
jgi:Wall-associated kinase